MQLRDDQVRRYSRHILLPDVGGVGQQRLLSATVSVDITPPAGAASAALAYLAAAGIGAIRLRGDATATVDERDVRSGIVYGAADVGRPRAEAITERLRALNPDVEVGIGDEGIPLELPRAGDAEHDVCTALITGGAAAGTLIAAIARGQGVRAR